jgi:hypothetical protein
MFSLSFPSPTVFVFVPSFCFTANHCPIYPAAFWLQECPLLPRSVALLFSLFTLAGEWAGKEHGRSHALLFADVIILTSLKDRQHQIHDNAPGIGERNQDRAHQENGRMKFMHQLVLIISIRLLYTKLGHITLLFSIPAVLLLNISVLQ